MSNHRGDGWRALDLDAEVSIDGAAETERIGDVVRFHRLPRSVDPQLDDGMRSVVWSTSGVRLRFRSSTSGVRVTGQPVRFDDGVTAPSPTPVIDLVRDDELVGSVRSTEGGVRICFDPTDPNRITTVDDGPAVFTFQTDPAAATHELWLPTGQFSLRSIEVDDRATPHPPPLDARPRWVHHGSSISHGLEAERPTGTWPAIVARRLGLHLVNLGFGGGCHLDQYVARHIARAPADLISLELGINIVNLATMRERTFVPAVHGFLDTIRVGHPDTPIVVISPIACPGAEHVPGPTHPDPRTGMTRGTGDASDPSALSVRRVRTALAAVVASRFDDPQLHLVDGLGLLGLDDAAHLRDGLHPNSAGHELLGARMAAQLPQIGTDPYR